MQATRDLLNSAGHSIRETYQRVSTYAQEKIKATPNPVTFVKNVKWKEHASATAVKIKELSIEAFKLLAYAAVIKFSPYMFAIGLTVGMAYPKATADSAESVFAAVKNSTLTEKAMIVGAAFFALPVVTLPLATLVGAAYTGSIIANRQPGQPSAPLTV